ncbi:hypothetical protein BTO06_12985 [Tenacibaculum sp. SZ-18]|nr:hypothetical protein BTO06_12985 [Tenacibaculum sp. SZ-18]
MVPSYNNLNALKNCIQSILLQSYQSYEVVIIDGDSTDGTKEFLQSLKRPFNYISEKDSGIYDAMNKGIRKARGEWLYFLGTDDVFSNEYVLEKVFQKSIQDEQLLFGEIQYQNGLKFKSSFSRKLWYKNTLHHQSAFYRRSLFSKTRFDTNLKILGDYQLNLKLFKSKVSFEQLCVVVAICGEEGVSKNYNWNLYKEEIQLKVGLAPILTKPFFCVLGIFKFVFRKLYNNKPASS